MGYEACQVNIIIKVTDILMVMATAMATAMAKVTDLLHIEKNNYASHC